LPSSLWKQFVAEAEKDDASDRQCQPDRGVVEPRKRLPGDLFTNPGDDDVWRCPDLRHQSAETRAAVPRKLRHTAKCVFDRLRDECGFIGGYTIIKDSMRERDQRRQEVLVPLSHPPGHAQADFGEAMVVIGGVELKPRFFVLDLPHSDGCYVQAYPAAIAEAWVDGHIHAFAFFGTVPQSIVYDNDRCLVAKILPDGTR
jgi:transposase